MQEKDNNPFKSNMQEKDLLWYSKNTNKTFEEIGAYLRLQDQGEEEMRVVKVLSKTLIPNQKSSK